MSKARKSEGKAEAQSADDKATNARLQFEEGHWLLAPAGDFIRQHNAPGIVPALENGIAIIAFLNRRAPRPATLADVSTTLGISRSHCHSLLKTLTYFDWLSFDEDTKMYHLQAGILSDASSLLNSPVISVVRKHLAAMVERLALPCVLSEPLSDDSFVVIDRFNAHHIMEVSFPIGHRFPRNAAAQMRAYLAWQSAERIDLWMRDWQPIAYTETSPRDPQTLRAEISHTPARLCAIGRRVHRGADGSGAPDLRPLRAGALRVQRFLAGRHA